MRRGVNWAGNIAFQSEEFHSPSSVDQLQALVGRGRRVRALGTGHSFNDIADSKGLLISVTDLPAEIEVDSRASTVRVAAGVRYSDLVRHLDEKGFALPNLASLPHISVGGSCATGTHGSGLLNGSLSTSVTGLQVVTADGELVAFEPGRDEAPLDGAVVSLGALGVVVSLTLALVPAFEMRQHVYEGLPLKVLDDHLTDILACAYGVSLFTDWRSSRMTQVWLKQHTDEPDRAVTQEPWFTARPAGGQRHPIAGMPPDNCTEQLGVRGRWFERLPHFRADSPPSSSGNELQSEYLLPLEHGIPALHALDRVRQHLHPVLKICEIRAVARDGLWMSPFHQRDTVAIHFTWIPDLAAVLPVVALLEAQLAPFQPRPHWGKVFGFRSEVLKDRYERMPEFCELVRRYDPAGKFRNAYLDRCLGEF